YMVVYIRNGEIGWSHESENWEIFSDYCKAKEYYDNGHTKAKKFFKKAPDYLKTKSAQKFWKQIKDWDSGQWWEDVVKFDR
ncbi:MAG: hypothetical protein KJ736_02315, partial [Candidatus Omnitrophica bacterium]|nr:hypothetical protein [Candidatus Omnitrophota bacterium]